MDGVEDWAHVPYRVTDSSTFENYTLEIVKKNMWVLWTTRRINPKRLSTYIYNTLMSPHGDSPRPEDNGADRTPVSSDR